MPFIPVDKTVKLEGIFLLDGQRIENVHHFYFGNGVDVINMEELAAFYINWFDTSLAPHLPNAIQLVLVKCTDLTIENGDSIEVTTGLPIAGDAASAPLPNNCTMTIKWITGRAGRSYRGRTYFPVLREDIVVGNMVDAPYAVQLLDVYANLIAVNLLTSDCQLVVVSRFHNNAPRAVGLVTPVINLVIDRVIDSQRRRLPGRGA